MANQKITELTELTTPASSDVVAIVDDTVGTPITKKITTDNLVTQNTAVIANTAKTGITSQQATDITTNNAKNTNVSTDLSEGTSTETTVDVNSSDGTNATLVSASTLRAGVLTKAKFDEIIVNNAKVSYTDAVAVSSNTTHRGLTNDPHNVTSTQVGLGNVTDDAQVPLTGGTMTGLLEIDDPTTTELDVIFRAKSAIADVKTEIFGRGTQRWDFTDGSSVYKGSIQYSTPGGNPGIVMRSAAEVGRTDIGMDSQTGGLNFGTTTTNNNPPKQMLLTTDGDLGIGALAPNHRLDIEDATTFVLELNNNLDSGNTNSGFVFSSRRPAGLIAAHSSILSGFSETSDNDESFMGFNLRHDGTGQIRAMTIRNGNLGLGVTEPSSANGWDRVMEIHGLNHAALVLKEVGDADRIELATRNGDFEIYTSGRRNMIMAKAGNIAVNENAGNFGIGVTNASEKLEVAGNIAVSGTVDGINIATDVAANTSKVSFTKTNIKGHINHGSTAGTARPTGFTSVEWTGDVEPSNSVNGDTWIDTT